MFRFETQGLSARKRLLNRSDVMSFVRVPGFIVNSFFGASSYHKQLLRYSMASAQTLLSCWSGGWITMTGSEIVSVRCM